MPRYSRSSLNNISTCHARLQKVFSKIIQDFDNTILQGHRNEQDQNKVFDEGKSQLQWPNGNHNATPSNAVDAIPYPIDWNDRERMSYFAGQVIATGREMGIEIRWGGDWAQSTILSDNSFDDLVHFELVL